MPRPAPRAIRQHLERLLSGQGLQGEPRLQTLLVHLVEETLAGRESQLEAYRLGVDVFGREPSFDPEADPMVANQVERLRRALAAYYLSEGLGSPFRIEIAPGTFVPEFRAVGAAARPAAGLGSGSAPRIARVHRSQDAAVVVLPFRTGPAADADGDLGAGVAAEVGLRLTRYARIPVVASHTAQAHRQDEVPDVRRIGADLDARYLVAGSLEWGAAEIALSARLYDTRDGRLAWVDRVVARPEPVAVRDMISRIAVQVAVRMAIAQGRKVEDLGDACLGRPARALSACEAVLRARRYAAASGVPPAPVLDALRAAASADGNYATAHALLAGFETGTALAQLPVGYRAGLERAYQYAGRAASADPACQLARWSLAYVHLHRHEVAQGAAEAERTVAANPNDAELCAAAGWALALLGRWERGLALLARHHWLNPGHPRYWHSAWYLDRYRQGDYEGALQYARLYDSPDRFWGPLFRCAALGPLGRREEAAAEAGRLLALQPDFATSGRERVRRQVFVDGLDEMLVAGVRRAGLAVR